MNSRTAPEIENRLAAVRQKRGLSAAQLAQLVGVSRQTIYAIEAGSYIPNTIVGLKLARALDVPLEELFSLDAQAPLAPARTERVSLLPGSETLQPGQPVQLCRVDKRLVASPPSAIPWAFPAADAVLVEPPAAPASGEKIKVQLLQAGDEFANRILIAGCDPGTSVLARHVQRAGVELVLAHHNSSESLALLKQGWVHIAGTHLRDEASGESNLPAIHRLFPKNAVAVISFAVWEEGIVVAAGNPKGIHAIEDLVRQGVTIVNREPGAGSRHLLDTWLGRLGVEPSQVAGYDDVAGGHLPAAWRVRSCTADACIATRAAARVFGLEFIPLVSERYDLAIRRQHLDLPAVQTILDTLSRAAFRQELEGMGGYDTRAAGRRLL